MYDVHLELIGKRVVYFILVIIELFFARCKRLRLRRYGKKIDRKSAISLQRREFDVQFQVEGDVPHQYFLIG